MSEYRERLIHTGLEAMGEMKDNLTDTLRGKSFVRRRGFREVDEGVERSARAETTDKRLKRAERDYAEREIGD